MWPRSKAARSRMSRSAYGSRCWSRVTSWSGEMAPGVMPRTLAGDEPPCQATVERVPGPLVRGEPHLRNQIAAVAIQRDERGQDLAARHAQRAGQELLELPRALEAPRRPLARVGAERRIRQRVGRVRPAGDLHRAVQRHDGL